MKRILMAGAGLFALAAASSPTLAADIPVRPPVTKAPPMAAPIFNWSGFYVGIQGGGGWGDVDWTYVGLGTTADHGTSGWLIGGTIGVNWQAPGSIWVLGIEGDYAWADIDGSTACPNPAWSCRSELESFGTLRGRLGWANNNWLFYGTGGLAFGRQRIETFLPGTGSIGQTKTATGWTAGLGVEAAWAGNWSGKLEWLYYDLGSDNYNVDPPLVVRAQHKGNIVRVGLNYRFGTY